MNTSILLQLTPSSIIFCSISESSRKIEQTCVRARIKLDFYFLFLNK